MLDYDALKFTSAEIQLKSSLPECISKADYLKLRTVLQKYLDFVQQHIQKLEGFFEEENIGSLSLTNPVMKAFVEEADEKLSDCTDAEVKEKQIDDRLSQLAEHEINIKAKAPIVLPR